MKKSLLVVLMAVAMVAPAFAAKGDMSVNAKVGLGVSNSYKMTGIDGDSNDVYMGVKAKTPFSVGAEFFYATSDILSVGVGANYILDSETTIGSTKLKGGTTNIYVAVKPEFKVESDFFTSVYLIGQLGLAMPRYDWNGYSPSVDSGIYLGAGFGTTIKDAFLVELVFSSSNGSVSEDGDSFDVQYTATTINVGYKFNI